MAEKLRAEISLTDNYTSTINQTIKSTRQAKKENETLSKSALDVGKSSSKAATQAKSGLSNISKGAKQAKKDVEQLNDSIDDTAQSGKGLLSNIRASLFGGGTSSGGVSGNPFSSWTTGALSFAAAGVAAKQAWDGAMSAINLSAMQKVQETTFQALLNHKAAGSALYDYVSAYAKVSALGREDIANAVTAYSTYTKNADQLEQLIKLTERLYAKDPTQGAEGAVFAMRELLSGDTMSIKDRFNMSGFSGETIRNFANTGDIEGLLTYVDQMFNKFGATQEVVDANFDGLITQTNIFTSNLKTAIAESATPAMEQLARVMQRLNADMDAGKYQPFINLMGNGMQLIGNGIAWVAENLNWIAPTVVGVVTALLIYKGTMMAVNAVQLIVAGTAQLLTGNWLGAAAALAAFVGAAAAVSAVSNDIETQTNLDVEEAKKKFAAFESELPDTMSSTVPVEVSNTAPISVKGEVEIEEESLRYMLDIQGQQWLAKFTTATLAPQNVFNNTVIRETADFDEFTQTTIESLQTVLETAPTL